MRLKRGSVVISSIVTAILVISTFSLFFASEAPQSCKGIELLYNLCLSAFGSGCVVLIVSIYEYRNARITSIRNFNDEAYSIITKIMNIGYIYIDGSKEVILEALRERETNQIINQLIESKELFSPVEVHYPNRDKLARYLCEVDMKFHPSIHCVNEEEFFRDKAEKELDYYIQRTTDVMKQYMDIGDIDLKRLRRLYQDIAFMSDLCLCRKNSMYEIAISQQIVEPLEKKIDEIKTASNTCFKRFSAPEPKLYNVLLGQIIDLQNSIFQLTITSQQNITVPIAENKFTDEINKRIEYWEQKIIKDKAVVRNKND